MQKLLKVLIKNKIIIFISFLYITFSLIFIFHRQHFWFDEYFTFEIVKSDIVRSLILMIGDGKPPLYYLLVKLYSIVFSNKTEIFLRFSSILFGIPFLIYLNKFLSEFITYSKVKILILILLISNPFFLAYSSEFRMYSFLASSTIIYTYYFYKFIIQTDPKYSKKYFLSKLLLIFTQYIGIFILAAGLVRQIIEKLRNNSNIFKVKENINLKSRTRLTKFNEILLSLKFEIIFLIIVTCLIYLQTKLFPNFNIFWVPHFDFSSIPNSFLILFLGLDPSVGGKSIPNFYNVYASQIQLISTLIYILLICFSIIIIKTKKLSKEIKSIFDLFALSIFIIIVNSTTLSINSYYMERYLIGILLGILIFSLIAISKLSTKIFIILASSILVLNLVVLYDITLGKIFTSVDTGAENSIHYYYTEEMDKCGWFYFDKIKKCP